MSSAAFLMAHFEFLQCRKCHLIKPLERKNVFKPHNSWNEKKCVGEMLEYGSFHLSGTFFVALSVVLAIRVR